VSVTVFVAVRGGGKGKKKKRKKNKKKINRRHLEPEHRKPPSASGGDGRQVGPHVVKTGRCWRGALGLRLKDQSS